MSAQSKRAKRLKHLCRLNPTKREVAHLPPDTEVSFLPMEKVSERGVLTLSETRSLTEVMNGFTYFRNGDVIVAKITPCFENGKGAECHSLANGIGFGSTEFHVLRPLPGVDSRFIFFLSCSQEFRHLGASLMYGAAGQQRVPEDFLANYEVLLPPLPEQRAIAAFLDRKTAQIDAVVARKQRLIERLQEKRQALISHAVTKGLDPDAPMKDSGIEWLGEIPAHWTLSKLSYVANIVRGASPRPAGDPLYFNGNAAPWITVAEVTKDSCKYLTSTSTCLTPEGQALSRLRGNTRELVGSAALVKAVRQKLLLCDLLYRFRSRPQKVDSQFLVMQLRSPVVRYQIEREATGTSASMKKIGQETIRSFWIVLPPLEEQDRIVAFVEAESNRISNVMDTLQNQIAKLQEYRQTLISAAVTGKIDVTKEAAC